MYWLLSLLLLPLLLLLQLSLYSSSSSFGSNSIYAIRYFNHQRCAKRPRDGKMYRERERQRVLSGFNFTGCCCNWMAWKLLNNLFLLMLLLLLLLLKSLTVSARHTQFSFHFPCQDLCTMAMELNLANLFALANHTIFTSSPKWNSIPPR